VFKNNHAQELSSESVTEKNFENQSAYDKLRARM